MLGSKPGGKPLDLNIKIKHLEGAILLFTFQESTATAAARDRMSVEGEVPHACTVVRILDMVEVLLLPEILAGLAVKRYPCLVAHEKTPGSVYGLYVRAILGF